MNFTFVEKFKSPVLAFISGLVISVPFVWAAAEAIHKKEIAVLEREQAALQLRLTDVEAELKATKGSAQSLQKPLSNFGRIDLESVISSLEAKIVSKKDELQRSAPIFVDGQKSDSNKQIESELTSLQKQLDMARNRLILGVGS